MPSPSDPADLEFTRDEMLQMGEAVLARSVAHVASFGEQPIRGDVDAAELCRALRGPAPEAPASLAPLLDRLFDELVPRSFTTPAPGYLAYIPGGGVYPAALADLIANTTNRYTGLWMAAPALVQLEANVLDWISDWMGFPAGAGGLLTTGGSMANFNAIVCARERALGADIRRGVLYTSTQVHHSVVKSARLAGIMGDRVRAVAVDEAFRMRVDTLAEAVEADRRAGLTPCAVVSTAGTTNTGAVDPLDSIADLCEREGLWHHVDGAYGACFHICPDLRPLLAGLPRADSVTLDPHKGLFLPYGTGALVVRDGAALRDAHRATASYMPHMPEGAEFYDPSQHGPDLSRGFPGLRVWMAVQLYGMARIRAAIAEKRALAVDAAERIGRIPGVELVAPPQLSLFAFDLDWPGATRAARNEATRRLMERVTARGRVMLTGCEVDGRALARVCVLSFRTRRDTIDTCVNHVAEEASAILAEVQP